jgi:dihydroorotate dehydrogenase (fumarate)
MNLTTTYMGLTLAHPFVAGASPLAAHLDTARRLEDGGAAAIVLHSLFEEQITLARNGRIHHMDPFEAEFAEALAGFPVPERYAVMPDEYLEHVRQVKAAVRIPVVASLNGNSAESWLTFGTSLEEAGADGLELNMYEIAIDPQRSSASIEAGMRTVVSDLKRTLRIPVAVKLSPFFTSFGHVAHQLDQAGADALVLFNRFYQPDIDVNTMTAVPRLELSSSAELLLRVRWLALLHGRVRCSLGVTGGVATPTDGIKAILAGAHVVQLVSAILRHGPGYFSVMRAGLEQWMTSQRLASIDAARGRADGSSATGSIFERANYIRTLQSWKPEDVER